MPFKLSSHHRAFRSFRRPALKMQHSYLLLFSFVALASIDSTKAITCSSATANYDDLPRQLPASIPNPVPPYRGLKYNKIDLLTVGDPPAGIMPASSPNVVGFSVLTAGATANVTVFGGGSGYIVFAPREIAFACAVGTVETVVSVPISCAIGFTGYKAGVAGGRAFGNYVGVVNGEVNRAMSVVDLRSFGNVDTITFEVLTPITQTAIAARFDDFKYFPCG